MATRLPNNARWFILAVTWSLLAIGGDAVLAAKQAEQANGSSAAPIPFKNCERDSQCRRHYQDGLSRSEAEQYEAALVSYQSAYARVQAPLLLLSIGRMHHRCGRPEQAADAYRKLLSSSLPESDADFEEPARRFLQEAEAEIAKKTVKPEVPPQTTVDGPIRKPTAQGEERTPVYKKWWLWTAVGVASAGIIIGASVGAYATRPLPADATHIRPFN